MKKVIILIILFIFCSSGIMLETCISISTNEPFILPDIGCPMCHCDPQMTDNSHLPVPEENVGIVWHQRNLSGERFGSAGFSVSNGYIAASTYYGIKDNLIIYDYNGTHIWSSKFLLNMFASISAPLIDIHNRVIACDNHYIIMIDPLDWDNDEKIIEWKSRLLFGGVPFSPVLLDDGIIVLVTKNGPLYVYDSRDGSLLAWKYLKDKNGRFETVNTPSVKENRIYISAQHTIFHSKGRLYAIDIDPYHNQRQKRISIAWTYNFSGPSGSSPLRINNTIYFDGKGFDITWKPHLYAVIDKGNHYEEKWNVSIDSPIDVSLAKDPRGGFWAVDFFNEEMDRYALEDGRLIESININTLLGEKGYRPFSIATISGNNTHPVIVVSAVPTKFRLNPQRPVFDFFATYSYIIAIDLIDNSLLWKVTVPYKYHIINFSFGQYPILMQNGKSRILFSTTHGGMWAIGEI